MNLAAGIPAADAAVQALPRAAAKTSGASADAWQRASEQAMQGSDAHTQASAEAPHAQAELARADKRVASPTAAEARSRKGKARPGKTDTRERRDTQQGAAAVPNAALVAPVALPAGAAVHGGSRVTPADQGARADSVRTTSTPAAGRTVTPAAARAVAAASGADAHATSAAQRASTPASSDAPVPGSALLEPDAENPRAQPSHAVATHATTTPHPTQTTATHNVETTANVQTVSVANAAPPAAAAVANLATRARIDRNADDASNVQAPNPAPAAVRADSAHAQKTLAALTSTPAGIANNYAVVSGLQTGTPATNPAAVVANHAAAGAAASNQNPMQQLGTQVHALYQGGGGQTTVQLNPPSLGSVQVHVQVQANHSVVVSFVASQPQAVQLIQAGIPVLTQALQQNHMQLAQAQVTLGTPTGGAGTPSGQQGSAAFQQPGRDPHAWHTGTLAPQGRDAGTEPASAAAQGVMAYA